MTTLALFWPIPGLAAAPTRSIRSPIAPAPPSVPALGLG